MAVPERIGRFDVDGRIGGGAFASVWRARDDALDSDVAIKVLSENWLDSADVRARFLAEARLLRRAESDRVVRVHDLGELDDGRPYLVMTYADKGTLDQRLADGRFSWRVATDVAVEIGKGLAVLHAAGVLHRDIKPSNILYRSTPGGGEQVLLGDLGLGKLLAEASMLTLAGGTPAYMAPEQARPGAPVSVRTDIYGLASLLYRALTGRTTHDSSTLEAVADPGRGSVRAPSALVADIPPALDAVVLRALEVEPERRHPDVKAFISELRDVLGDRVPAAGLTVAGPTQFASPEVTMPVHHAVVPTRQSVPSQGFRPSTPPQDVQSAPGGFRPPTPPQGTPPQGTPPRSTPPQGFYPPQGAQPPSNQTLMYGSQPSRPPAGHPPSAPPRKRRRWLVPVVVAVVLLALAGGAGVWYYLRQPVDVINHDKQIEVSVPRSWAAETQDGWQPSVLTGGGDTTVGEGLLVAESAAEFSRTDSTKPGIFVGLLPAGDRVNASAFQKAVTAPGCSLGRNPVSVTGQVASIVQVCGDLIMNDVLLTHAGRHVWIRTKQPSSDTTNAATIITAVQITPR